MIKQMSRLAGAALTIGAALTSQALAQTAPTTAVAATQQSDTTSFAAAYFAPYNPVTAADMVSRIPGFELRDGDDRRGFGGTAGNLLINGERPSSKATPSDLLKRIPATDVARIDVVAGTNAQSDVRGQSQFRKRSRDSCSYYRYDRSVRLVLVKN